MDTKESGLISALESFWNGWATARKEKDVILIVCASATYWMIDNIVNAKGGLHNRLTGQIHLKPFTLGECKQYLESKKIILNLHQILMCYMILGGIPFYWSLLKKGKSLPQNIDELFFKENALLANEYENLYRALFNKPDQYLKIVKANPITLSQDNILIEGHTRYLAAQKAGIKKIAVVYKHFASRLEMLEYAYKQQLHRRNLSEQEIFTSYKKLRELTNEDGKKAKTDVEIAEELHVSPRQLTKMKEVEKKASPKIMEAFTEGTISLNQAYNQMKDDLKPAEEQVEVQEGDAATSVVDETKKTSSKPKKASADKPAMEKLNLKFKPEDFALLQNAADASNFSVAEYVMNLVMSSVQTNSAIETVSEIETA